MGRGDDQAATKGVARADHYRGVEQWYARRAHYPEVAGSIPAPASGKTGIPEGPGTGPEKERSEAT